MRLSSMQTGTDVTVDPRVVSKPVEQLSDDELFEEMEKLRGMRGVAIQAQRRTGGVTKPQGPVKLTKIGA